MEAWVLKKHQAHFDFFGVLHSQLTRCKLLALWRVQSWLDPGHSLRRPSMQTPTCCCLLSSCWATLPRRHRLRPPSWSSL